MSYLLILINTSLAIVAAIGTFFKLKHSVRTVLFVIILTFLFVSAVLQWCIIQQKNQDIFLASLCDHIEVEAFLQDIREYQEASLQKDSTSILQKIKIDCWGAKTDSIPQKIADILTPILRKLERSSNTFNLVLKKYPSPERRGQDSLANWVELVEQEKKGNTNISWADYVLLKGVTKKCQKHHKLIEALSNEDEDEFIELSIGLDPKTFFANMVVDARESDDRTVRLYHKAKNKLESEKWFSKWFR